MNLLAGILKCSRRAPKSGGLPRFLRNFLVTAFWSLDAVVLFYAVENWRGARRFAEVKHRLEQRGANLDWKSFAPAAIPDEQNAAMHPLLRPLCQYERTRAPHPKWGWSTETRWLDSNGLQRVWSVRLPLGWRENGKFIAVETNNLDPSTDLVRWQTCFRHSTNFPSPAQPGAPAQDVLVALAKFDHELRELREAVGRPQCRFAVPFDDRPDDMLLKHLYCLKALAQVLKLRATAQLAVGAGENALADTEDIFRLADGLKDEPVLSSFLTRVAIHRIGSVAIGEGLARQAWSESQLVRLQAHLARQELLAGLDLVLKGETASALQTLDTIRADGGYFTCQGFESLRWVPGGWFEQNKAMLADHMYQRGLPAFDASTHRVCTAAAKAEQDRLKTLPLSAYSVFAITILPNTCNAVRSAARAQTVNDQALLACALERHRLATGRFPESLAALSPDYLSAVPRDVVDGAPLRYRSSPNGGFLLWSVGWNESDEAGSVSRSKDGSLKIEEGDWVWEWQAAR